MDKNTINKPKIPISHLIWFTIAFTILSFFLNSFIYTEKTPQAIVLIYTIVGFIFFMGIIGSWLSWLWWKLKKIGKK